MMKKHLKVLIISSVVILIPMLAGIILWKQLPDRIPIHWNAAGEVDGWGSKALAVYGLPAIMLAVQWLGSFMMISDPKRAGQSKKMLGISFWIIPILSIVVFTITYIAAMGKDVRMEAIVPVFMWLLFVIIGNYMPKCRQNYTVGIKIPWTLASEENWNKTHRFAGRIWVICGLIMMAAGWFGGAAVFFVLVLLMVLVPMVYSFILHRKGI